MLIVQHSTIVTQNEIIVNTQCSQFYTTNDAVDEIS